VKVGKIALYVIIDKYKGCILFIMHKLKWIIW
jgi:hypothetical protein